MKNYLLPIAQLGSITSGTLLAIALFSWISPAVALSPVEVQRIAKQTTIEISGCDLFGSGVIIRKNGNTYTVLTVAHNFQKRGCQMVAPDNTKYPISQVKLFPNKVDLAVFTFVSDKNYPVAKLIDNSERVEAGETIYVSGFPLSTAISQSIFMFVKGEMMSNSSTIEQGNGYSMIYSNNTLPGHSGGPVWNDRGQLIAIHGRGDVDTKLQETINDGVRIKTGSNLGIPVNTFTKLAIAVGLSEYTPVVATAKPKPVDDLVASAAQKERKGDYRGMLADLERAIKLNPQNALLYYNRGNAKFNLRNNQGAIEDYSRAIEIDPNATNFYYKRGYAKEWIGDNKGAVADYSHAIEIDPSNIDAYYNRGFIRYQLGDNQGAIADYSKILSLPNDSNPWVYIRRGNAQYKLGDTKAAIEDYNRAIAIDPSLAKSESVRAAISIDSYNSAVARNPKDASAYFRRARAKDEFNDKKGAIEDYNQAIALAPNFAEAYYHRANTKEQLGDIKGAVADFDRSSTLNPKHTPTYIRRGSIKYQLGDKKGAVSDWRKAAKIYQQQGQLNDYKFIMKSIERVGS
ncbi:tetratricopeptide repeat-containing S1 family peptidase [Chamaesiphon polymorphus]|uniref:Uncharacterized protein n=1 Tax=Chamaesiphon polymorphus CCALA 037 TaxID=2107692 RepID=A0A2T1GK00_9CYAN|nr:tetratricopeptide repeat-containing serine protease family protein [Chamaesiphon polymorphus]PSB58141.1 hypothetical protein C7B77_05770 [Chamaesiphon polymorphus CCALA 037]